MQTLARVGGKVAVAGRPLEQGAADALVDRVTLRTGRRAASALTGTPISAAHSTSASYSGQLQRDVDATAAGCVRVACHGWARRVGKVCVPLNGRAAL